MPKKCSCVKDERGAILHSDPDCPACSPVSDDELTMSMYVFIERHGERMIKATAEACRMIAANAARNLDGTSEAAWKKAGAWIDQAHSHLEEN